MADRIFISIMSTIWAFINTSIFLYDINYDKDYFTCLWFIFMIVGISISSTDWYKTINFKNQRTNK